MAPWPKCRALAEVSISLFVSSNPTLGSLLSAQRSSLWIHCPPLSAPPPAPSLKNK